MTTMLNAEIENKSVQSFRIPLEIVRDEHQHHHQYSSSTTTTPTYGGDLLLTVSYKRNILQVIEWIEWHLSLSLSFSRHKIDHH